MSITSLRQLHEAAGAHYGDDNSLPCSYGDVRAEYAAIRGGVAVLDFSPEGKLEVSGKNAAQFINGLVTNEVKTLPAGRGVPAAFLDAHGKVSALCRIYNIDGRLLIQLHPERREKIYSNLKRFTLAGEFFLNDLTEQQALISLQGPRAAALLESLTGAAVSENEITIAERVIADQTVLVATHARCGEAGFDLFIAAEAAPQVWQAIIARGAEYDACAVGQEAFEIARIEAAVPREGTDVNDTHILLEAGLDNSVSYTKGCYLGQEIIARIHWRGQPAKRLMKLSVSADAPPPAGVELYGSDGKKVGAITSSTRGLANDGIIALGYVHRYYIAPGTELTIRNGETETGRATVIALPATADQPQPESQASTP
ncbi:MAG TPA: glycine cleavage T C-terminal barrel domain-containing protein [Blastocatellia bacterium]|nr:glycine cleavage T C-terminal barrel domain-containing protein [Blastocatellia bacterium]